MRSTIKRTEKTEQNDIIALVRKLGGNVWTLGTHRRSTDFHGTMQSPGLPDLIIWIPGNGTHPQPSMIDWEVKTQIGKRRPEQLGYGAACESAGRTYGFGTFGAFTNWLVKEGRIKL